MGATVFTIGYQGTSIELLIAALTRAHVSVLIDTRETPMSRRPEFRAGRLREALADAGSGYLPAKALGAPKPLRSLAVDDWDGFADGYRERLRLVREEIESLLPVIKAGGACLLCFEADPAACHRSLLAHDIQNLLDTAAIRHLRPGRPEETDDHERVWVTGDVAEYKVQIGRL